MYTRAAGNPHGTAASRDHPCRTSPRRHTCTRKDEARYAVRGIALRSTRERCVPQIVPCVPTGRRRGAGRGEPWAGPRSHAAAASTQGTTRRITRCCIYRLATKGLASCVLPTRCVLEAASPCKAARKCTLHACTSHFIAPKFCYLAYGLSLVRLGSRSAGRRIAKQGKNASL